MFEMTGKYGTAKVYATTVEGACLDQIRTFMNSPVVEGCNIAIMPDCHAGAGACIGFTQTMNGRVNPSMVGVDIGCGMLVLKIDKTSGDAMFNEDGLRKFDEIMHTKVPSGLAGKRDVPHRFAEQVNIEDLVMRVNVDTERYSVGSLGGGNHFVEIDKGSDGSYYIVIHSGSRHLGYLVARQWENEAVRRQKDMSKAKSDLIAKLKREGREKEISERLASLPKIVCMSGLSYLEGDGMQGYIHDMEIAQRFAETNREAMMDTLVSEMGIAKRHILDKFCTIHNYIDIKNGILRKGAISLEKDEIAIIPMNMSDGSLIVRGKGNPEWNRSGPHGAGRLMSRKQARESITMDAFRESMKDVYTTSVSEDTLDESKMAYKPMEEIVEAIGDTCDIVETIKPIYNFKAGE